jgi:actin-related protein 3
MDYFIGQEAMDNQKTHQISYLLKGGQIEDWEGIEKFWHKSIYSYLRCEPEEHRFILTEPPLNSPENRQQMAEIMFETFGVKGLFIGVQATLALYSQICGLDRENRNLAASDLTGIVIDSGDGVTHVFPVSDGFVIGSCVKHIPLAGRDITKFVLNSMRDRKEPMPSEDALEIARNVKEKYGYVCNDLVKEYKKFDKKNKAENGEWYLSNKFKKYLHKPSSGGKPIEIDVGYERFLGPEMFFHPEFFHQDWRTPLDEVIDNAIQSCPMDYRRRLYQNIVLSGGSTLFDGFDKKLNDLVQKRVDTRLDAYEKLVGTKSTPIEVKVHQNMVQRYAVWFGGSVLGSNENFPTICHSKAQYEEYGPSICRHNQVFAASY